ncbi:MAG: hypothetical protein QOI42_1051, partial [Frankiaceae bacterium]|nr:hypothetical protein [Frankiaceae bacterium]
NDTGDGGPLSPTVKLDDFFLVTHDLRTGAERVFNKGLNCATRDPGNPCGPLDGPAYLPKYLPGGHSIAYMGVLDSATVCICAVDADGSDPRVLLSFKTQTVNWYDFTVPGSQPATSATPLSAAPADRLLVLGTDAAGTPELFIATPDNWTRVRVRLPKKLQVVAARWGVDGRHVLLTARTAPVRAATVRPEPAPPPGQARHVHYTLGSLSALTLATAPTDRTSVDREQLFSMDIVTGTATALTTPGTEDWLDGIPSGAWRGNGAGVVTPDHRSVVFASYASDTDESFLLRKNLATGSVRSLTAQTAGAVPVYDDKPAVSSDGTTVAFTTGTGTSTNIALISATTGEHYRLLTNDDYVNTTPVWSPDGTWVAYASLRGGKWALVRVDVATGRQTVLARTYGQPVSPVVAPDGSRVAFIAYNVAPAQPDVQIVNASGGTLRPLQVTLATKEVSLDWR